MDGKPKKLVLIGLDAPTVEDILRYTHSGDMPNVARLIQGGTFCEHCLVPFPTITPPNWTSIVTGAFPGTHGITCFHMHDLGEPLNIIRPAFDSRDCRAEYIWEAAERIGMASIVLNYPSTWPPRLKLGVQVGGAGLSINEWRLKGLEYGVTVNGCQLFSTEEYPQATQVQIRPAADWANMPFEGALECELSVAQRRSKYNLSQKSYYLLISRSSGDGLWQCFLCRSKDFKDKLATLAPNKWSDILKDSFETDDGIKEAVFMAKILELSHDGKTLKLYMTAFCQVDGWSYPSDVASMLPMDEGMPLPAHEPFFAFNLGWVDDETFIEELEMHHRWLADAAEYLMRTVDWTLFFMHAHCPDWMYHSLMKRSDPSCTQNADERSRALEIIRRMYVSIDRMIGRIVSAAGEETLIVIVSDHGALPSPHGHVPIMRILCDAGLLAMKVDEKTGREVVDWDRTKAFPQRSVYIYVNLKGRNPNGIVEPGEEYERVRDEIINALLDWRDPNTGERPIIMALRKEDARPLGIYGDAIGDVVYAVRPAYGGEHGQHLPTAQYSRHSMRGLLILFGPGIKSGCRLHRTVWLTDITPTVCFLMGIPYPKQCEGAVLYQALMA
ncbi:MAG: alkaline phosphatase family protein [Armatimonadota bacterium]|nr:alkaline phosphatase family protein [Armatimonadota bacterium]MCX7777619.1 alkaline phosphatase family protein [Armatimonadota bacterium]MDW8024702.1 alkaline phosphatase family protein [Armatimonadota bacterium]